MSEEGDRDSWVAKARTDPGVAADRRDHARPAEEHDDLDADPREREDLADEPEYPESLAGPGADLDARMTRGGDLGLETERTPPETRTRKGAAK